MGARIDESRKINATLLSISGNSEKEVYIWLDGQLHPDIGTGSENGLAIADFRAEQWPPGEGFCEPELEVFDRLYGLERKLGSFSMEPQYRRTIDYAAIGQGLLMFGSESSNWHWNFHHVVDYFQPSHTQIDTIAEAAIIGVEPSLPRRVELVRAATHHEIILPEIIRIAA